MCTRNDDMLEASGYGTRKPIQPGPRRDPQIALGADRERQDIVFGRWIEATDRGRTSAGVEIKQVRRRTSDEHSALRRKHEAPDDAIFGPGKANPAREGCTR